MTDPLVAALGFRRLFRRTRPPGLLLLALFAVGCGGDESGAGTGDPDVAVASDAPADTATDQATDTDPDDPAADPDPEDPAADPDPGDPTTPDTITEDPAAPDTVEDPAAPDTVAEDVSDGDAPADIGGDGSGLSVVCTPCTGDEQCGESGACTELGDGRFCGFDCSASPEVCGEQYACVEILGDSPGWLCLPATGFCASCPNGFLDEHGDGTSCLEIDECAEELDDCDPLVDCENLDPTEDPDGRFFACGDCPEGYLDDAGDGTSCSDVLECDTDNGGCGDPLYWSCIENVGATPTCADIDECAIDNGGCGLDLCIDQEGAPPECDDVDECLTDNGGCGDATYWLCTNVAEAPPTCSDILECEADNGECGPALYWACVENEGAAPTCVDIDECEGDPNGCGDPDYWDCTDNEGAAPTCADIDECAGDPNGCGAADYWDCTNNEGAAPTCVDVLECAADNGGCGLALHWTCVENEGAAPTCLDIDECVTQNGGCAQTCTNQDNGFACSCTTGYVLNADGHSCDDVLECATDNGGCGDADYWLCGENVGGSPTCTDINECAAANGGCAQTCTNEDNGFACSCGEGYTLNEDGLGCDDVLECLTDNGDCGDADYWLCTENVGGPPSCTDIDECDTDNGGCFQTCNNHDGGFACSCGEGYTLDEDGFGCNDVLECAADNGDCGDADYWLCGENVGGPPTCTDIDECLIDNGGCEAEICVNIEGAPAECDDVDECLTDNGGCGDAQYWLCTNHARSAPTCSDVLECAVDNGECGPALYWACAENEGAPPTCTDIDECATGNGGCAQTCANHDDGFTCSCGDGYTLNEDGLGCDDVLECADDNGDCGDPGQWLCNETVGGPPTCTDIDECLTANGGCAQTCDNHDDGFTCSCGSGYSLNADGHSCDDVLECATANGGCGDPTQWLCNEVVGGPPTCTDIDECLTDNGGCRQICSNHDNGFTCSCNAGFTLNADGRGCSDVLECASNNGGCGSASHWLCGENVGGPPTCTDIDECDTANGGCAQTCTNHDDGFTCTCGEGYTLNPNGLGCDDVLECAVANGGCGSAVYWLCGENVGGPPTCTDIDECTSGNGGCAQDCDNHDDGYTCSCGDGYTLNGDGHGCDDVLECAVDNGGCGDPLYWQCNETAGGPPTCVDIDECAVENGGCWQVCTNRDLGYDCSCSDGYTLNADGFSCDDVPECDTDNGDCGDPAIWHCAENLGAPPSCSRLIDPCGDGIVTALFYELCDEGELNSDDTPDACRTTCLPARCGDGVIDSGEQCDDGDETNLDALPDGCRASCFLHFCGDGVVDSDEECDDGNNLPNDGCDASCAEEFCGDGIVQDALGEECDEGDTASGDGCGPTCATEFCGDRIHQAALGESCDEGPNGGLTCLPDCTPRPCGGPEICDLVDNDCDGQMDETCPSRVVLVNILESGGGGAEPFVLPVTCEHDFGCNDQNIYTEDACVGGLCRWTYLPCDGQDFDACTDGRHLTQDGPCVNTGPMLLWDFEDEPVQIVDQSGSGYNGIPVDAAFGTGRFGAALDTRAALGVHVSRRLTLPTTNFTLSAWIATTTVDGGILAVLGGEGAIGDDEVPSDRALDLVDGEATFTLDHVTAMDELADTEIADGDWHHLALTCEKDVACVLYVDGVAHWRTTYWFDTESTLRNATRFVVGWSPTGGWFDGRIDQVAVFEYAMRQADVVALSSGIITRSDGRNAELCDETDWDCDGTAANRCDDGDACTTDDVCSAGVCEGTAVLPVDDENSCTEDICDPFDGSTAGVPLDGVACDDVDPCTGDDICEAGVCVGEPQACEAEGLMAGREVAGALDAGADRSYGFIADRAIIYPTSQESNEAIIYYLRGDTEARCFFPLNDTQGSFGTWVRNPANPNHYYHHGPIAFSPARQRSDGVWECWKPFYLFTQDFDVGLDPFTLGGKLTVPWPSEGFMADISMSPPPVSVNAPYLSAGIATGASLRYLGAPLEDGREYIFLSGLLGAQLSMGGAIPPIPFPGSVQATFILDPSDPMVFLSFMRNINVRDGIDRAYNARYRIPGSPIVDIKAGALAFSAQGNINYRAPLDLWFGEYRTAADGLPAPRFEPAVNPNSHFYMMGQIGVTPLTAAGQWADFKFDITGRIAVSMDPQQNGYNPGRAAEIIWNKIFTNDWSDGPGLAATDLDMRFQADGDLGLVLPQWDIGPIRTPPLTLPLASAGLLIDTTPSQELVAFRGRTRINFLGELPFLRDILAPNGIDLFADLAGYVRRNGDATRWALSFEIGLPLPIGGMPFGGRVEIGVDDGEFFANLYGRVDVGRIRLNPELDLGTIGPVLLEWDGERFCAAASSAVPASSTDASGNARSTTCSVRLCLGEDGLDGSTFACEPFCTGNSECAAIPGRVCAYGVCQAPLANGAPCTESAMCASQHCYAGSCVECWPGQGECSGDYFCDLAGYCQDLLETGELCVSLVSGINVMRDDWCESGQCDTTCVECWSPNLINVARGLIDPNYRTFDCPAGQVCSDFGVCMPERQPGESCYSAGAVRGLDSWCSTDSCGDPAWTCRECNATTYDGTVLSCDAETEWCDDAPVVGSNTCLDKFGVGDACFGDRECLSGYCSGEFPIPGSCYELNSKAYGAGCLEDDECVSGNCQVTFCGCNGSNANCPEAGQNCIAGDICVTPVANGVPCTDHGECISGHCAGLCVECLENTHCSGGDICFSGACVPPAANGTPCTEPWHCASGRCPNALCVECEEHGDCSDCVGEGCNPTGYTLSLAPGWPVEGTPLIDELHNVATRGDENDDSGIGEYAPGDLTDGVLGGGDVFVDPVPYLGWTGFETVVEVTFQFPVVRDFSTVTIGLYVVGQETVPENVAVSLSDDGTTFTEYRSWQRGSTLPSVPDNTRSNVTLDLSGARARYVRITSMGWLFTDEITFSASRPRWCDIGGACHSPSADGVVCADPIECQSGHCSNIGLLPGFCYTPGNNAYGDICQVDGECASGDCQAGLCSCAGNWVHCPGTESCTATNLCVAGGVGCNADGNCRSGRCGNDMTPPILACVECEVHADCHEHRPTGYTLDPAPNSGTWSYFDEAHNVATRGPGHELDNSGIGEYAPGQLTDGVRGTNQFIGDTLQYPFVGWDASQGSTGVNLTFDFESVRDFSSVSIGFSNQCCGLALPNQVRVWLSDNGLSYTFFNAWLKGSTLPSVPVGQRGDVTLDLDGASARFILISFENAEWMFIDEIEFASPPQRWCDVFGVCNDPFPDGHACATAVECLSGHCNNIELVPGFCYTPFAKAYGDTCIYSDECASNDCQAGLCSCNGSYTNCPGEESCNAANLCTANGTGCSTEAQCRSGHCGNLLAVPIPACVECNAHAQCGADRWCDAFGTCQDEVANNEVCLTAVECSSGYCSNLGPVAGRCYTPGMRAYAEVCQVDDECASGDCQAGLCSCNGSYTNCPGSESCNAANLCTANGVGCSADAQCRTGHCGDLACVECEAHDHCGEITVSAPGPSGYAFSPAPNSGSWNYFDEPHNIATRGNALDNSGIGEYAPGQLTDGVRGTNNFIGVDESYPWVGWHITPSPTTIITFEFPVVRDFSTVSIGFSNQCCGLILPNWVAISLSDDGATFAPLNTWHNGSTLPSVPAGQRGDVVLDMSGARGRYVRITMQQGSWTFVDEIAFAQPTRTRWCDLGGACHDPSPDGTVCANALECMSEHCSNLDDLPGFCYTPFAKAYGATCVYEDECASGDCQAGLCSCNGTYTNCPGTESCNAANLCTSNGTGCTTDAHCRSGHCGNSLPVPINACVECIAHNECGTDRWCDATGTCRNEVANGEPCLTAVECQSGNCNNVGAVPGFCYALNSKANGATCNYDNECISTRCGDVSHLCSECEADNHCGSQQACVAGACVGTCGNGTCEIGFGEFCSTCSDCACGSMQNCVAGVCIGTCGNGTCELGFGETCANCSDCGCGSGYSCTAGVCTPNPYCGDGSCTAGEDCTWCPGDCGGCFGAACSVNSDCQSGNCADHWSVCSYNCNPHSCCARTEYNCAICGEFIGICGTCCVQHTTCYDTCFYDCNSRWCDL